MGRQFASGLSLALTSIRFFLSSAAHGVYGKPPGMFAPASKNVAIGGPFGSNGTGSVDGSSDTPPLTGAKAAFSPVPAAPGQDGPSQNFHVVNAGVTYDF